GRARLARAPGLEPAAAAAARDRTRVRRARGRAPVDGRVARGQLREARRDDVRGVVLPALLRGAELGGARRLHRPVRRLVLRLAGADEHDREQARRGLRRALVHLPRTGRGGRGEAPPARSAPLLALPRRGRPLAPPRRVDVDLPDRVARRHDRARHLVGEGRAARAAAAGARLPATERRPDLARRRAYAAKRQRSPSSSEVTHAAPGVATTAIGCGPTVSLPAT